MKVDYDSKTPDDRKYMSTKAQRSGVGAGIGGRANWGGRNSSKNGDKSRSLGSSSRNSKVPLGKIIFGSLVYRWLLQII